MPNQSRLLVFTDLDGTLLDHDTYAWDAARPALERLQAHDTPLILNSSKTIAEQQQLCQELGINHPLAAENGQVIGIPGNYFPQDTSPAPMEIECLGLPVQHLSDIAGKLRTEHGFRFRGFSELSDAEVAELCSFPIENAVLARRRDATEPLHWQDTEERLVVFQELARDAGLQVVRGGRFVHLSGKADKGTALQRITGRFQDAQPNATFRTIALGDSDNDLPMLKEADFPVVMLRRHGNHLTLPGSHAARLSDLPGPDGWNLAMLSLLDELGYS